METWLLGVSKGVSLSFNVLKPKCQVSVLVSRLLNKRFQFRFKFQPRKLFHIEYGLFQSSTSWRFCFITMIGPSCSSDNRVRRAIASENVDLGIILSPVKPKTQKLVLTASLLDA